MKHPALLIFLNMMTFTTIERTAGKPYDIITVPFNGTEN